MNDLHTAITLLANWLHNYYNTITFRDIVPAYDGIVFYTTNEQLPHIKWFAKTNEVKGFVGSWNKDGHYVDTVDEWIAAGD